MRAAGTVDRPLCARLGRSRAGLRGLVEHRRVQPVEGDDQQGVLQGLARTQPVGGAGHSGWRARCSARPWGSVCGPPERQDRPPPDPPPRPPPQRGTRGRRARTPAAAPRAGHGGAPHRATQDLQPRAAECVGGGIRTGGDGLRLPPVHRHGDELRQRRLPGRDGGGVPDLLGRSGARGRSGCGRNGTSTQGRQSPFPGLTSRRRVAGRGRSSEARTARDHQPVPPRRLWPVRPCGGADSGATINADRPSAIGEADRLRGDHSHVRHPQFGSRWTVPRGDPGARRPLAGRQLPRGGPDLPDGEPAAARAAAPRAHQTPVAGPLGHLARPEPCPHPPQPCDQRTGPRRRLRLGPRSRRARRPRELLAGRQLHGHLPGRHPRRRRHGEAVPAVLLPRRSAEPCRTGDPGIHPRGR